MKIFLKSNFILAGLGRADSIDFDESEMTVREFFDKLTHITAHQYEFIDPDSHEVNTQDWGVEINGMPYEVLDRGLDAPLAEGDTVGIMILPIGGG